MPVELYLGRIIGEATELHRIPSSSGRVDQIGCTTVLCTAETIGAVGSSNDCRPSMFRIGASTPLSATSSGFSAACEHISSPASTFSIQHTPTKPSAEGLFHACQPGTNLFGIVRNHHCDTGIHRFLKLLSGIYTIASQHNVV